MKSQVRLFALLFLSVTFSITLLGQDNMRIAMVDFMRVPEGGEATYEKLEKEIWKPMHQKWVDEGRCEGWFFYRIPYPGGTDADYHYATVRLYSDLSQIENPLSDMGDVFAAVHPGKDIEKMGEQTLASRDLTKTYGLSSWHSFFGESMSGPSEIITVVYFEVPFDKWDAYQEMEKKYFHPTHKAEIEANTRSGWEGWMLSRPMGMNQPFQFVAVDHYKDWAQYTSSNPDGLHEKVFSGNELEIRDQIFNETVKLVNLEEWRLIDYAMDEPLSAGTGNE